jgi:Domain of unknown function (DUF4337)
MDLEKDEDNKVLENRIALTITLFAAILAINGLFGGKYGDDEMIAHQKHSQMYSWYQSKGQKKMLAENKKDMLEIFKRSGMVNMAHISFLDSISKETDNKLKKYQKEMNEIQEGSAKVGEKNWIQEQDGKLGGIIGAEEYEAEANKLGTAGDFFDFGDLALNLCLVLGAVALILSNRKDKIMYLTITLTLGSIGAILTSYAMYLAMA